LTQADVAELIGVSAGTIGKDIKAYQTEQGIILPYRGTVHDIGPSLTHKKVIIEKFLQGIPTPDISRMTQHTEEACDRYIKAFKKVRMLHGKMKPLEISRIIGMSERLVNEYIALIDASFSPLSHLSVYLEREAFLLEGGVKDESAFPYIGGSKLSRRIQLP
jgi:DNA-binding XRE family transcriptional regulator